MVVVNPDGQVVEGDYRPSTDTPTHLVLYQRLAGIAGVVHTHSTWATAWAQADRAIPVMGTTHADLSHMEILIHRPSHAHDVQGDYEIATGHAVVAAVAGRPAAEVPAVLVSGHGTFCWGSGPEKAVEAAIALEAVAKMAWLTVALAPSIEARYHITRCHFSCEAMPDGLLRAGLNVVQAASDENGPAMKVAPR